MGPTRYRVIGAYSAGMARPRGYGGECNDRWIRLAGIVFAPTLGGTVPS